MLEQQPQKAQSFLVGESVQHQQGESLLDAIRSGKLVIHIPHRAQVGYLEDPPPLTGHEVFSLADAHQYLESLKSNNGNRNNLSVRFTINGLPSSQEIKISKAAPDLDNDQIALARKGQYLDAVPKLEKLIAECPVAVNSDGGEAVIAWVNDIHLPVAKYILADFRSDQPTEVFDQKFLESFYNAYRLLNGFMRRMQDESESKQAAWEKDPDAWNESKQKQLQKTLTDLFSPSLCVTLTRGTAKVLSESPQHESRKLFFNLYNEAVAAARNDEIFELSITLFSYDPLEGEEQLHKEALIDIVKGETIENSRKLAAERLVTHYLEDAEAQGALIAECMKNIFACGNALDCLLYNADLDRIPPKLISVIKYYAEASDDEISDLGPSCDFDNIRDRLKRLIATYEKRKLGWSPVILSNHEFTVKYVTELKELSRLGFAVFKQTCIQLPLGQSLINEGTIAILDSETGIVLGGAQIDPHQDAGQLKVGDIGFVQGCQSEAALNYLMEAILLLASQSKPPQKVYWSPDFFRLASIGVVKDLFGLPHDSFIVRDD